VRFFIPVESLLNWYIGQRIAIKFNNGKSCQEAKIEFISKKTDEVTSEILVEARLINNKSFNVITGTLVQVYQ
jgi:hypothetical protein